MAVFFKQSAWRLGLILAVGLTAVAFGRSGTTGQLDYWIQNDEVYINQGKESLSGSITIPAQIEGLPVIHIEDLAFADNSSIRAVTFPSTLKQIDYRAFYKCDGLSRIDLPQGIESVGEQAFWDCQNVTRITLPSSLISIGDLAFASFDRLASFDVNTNNPAYADLNGVLYNKKLTSLIIYPERWNNRSQTYAIPNGVEGINDRAFDGAGDLRTITIPSSVIHIGDYAFNGCGNLTSVALPDATVALGEGAFASCGNLRNITIPAATEYIGKKAFESCSRMTAISVNPSNAVYSSIGGVLCNKDQTRLITFPRGKSGVYTVPDGIKHIGYRAFYRCDSLTQINLADTVETLGDEVFYKCYDLTRITFSSSVNTLGNFMFRECNALTSIDVDPANPLFSDIDGVLFNKEGTELMAFPPGRGGSYTVPDGVKTIGGGAFAYCDFVTSITLPSSVASLDREAFLECDRLAQLTLPGSLERLGGNLVDKSKSLKSISVNSPGSELASVDGVLFNSDKTKLLRFPEGRSGRYAIPEGTKTIDWHAFYQNENLTSVSLPSSLELMENNAFEKCTDLRTAIFLGNAPLLGGDAFKETANDFLAYYLEGTFGYTSPTWNGYPSDLLYHPRLSWLPDQKITWFAQRNIDYSVDSTTNLVSGEWVSTHAFGQGTTNEIQPYFTTDSEMYRVNISLP